MSIEVVQTKKGERRYKVRLRDPAGEEYTRRFRTRKEAELFERTERTDQARGSWLDPRGGDLIFSKWAADWLMSNPDKSPGSRARDEANIRLHINPLYREPQDRRYYESQDSENRVRLVRRINAPKRAPSVRHTAARS